ncbi:MAG: glutamine amidotransferase [Dehalococcoidia bacterium]
MVRVVVLYPDVMNVYADRGNLIALQARAREHDIDLEVTSIGVGDPMPEAADLVLIGGGQDREQERIASDLAGRGPRLREWADAGTSMLAVCGGFQLFGRSYHTSDGREFEGVGIFDVVTVAPAPGAERCIGDIVIDSSLPGVGEVVGFENHGGRTFLGIEGRPFARVRYGFGNNGDDGTEGAIAGEGDAVIGTYLHGSVLPKNPALTDHLLRAALRHRYGGDVELERPQAGWAERAHDAAVAVARRRGRRAR